MRDAVAAQAAGCSQASAPDQADSGHSSDEPEALGRLKGRECTLNLAKAPGAELLSGKGAVSAGVSAGYRRACSTQSQVQATCWNSLGCCSSEWSDQWNSKDPPSHEVLGDPTMDIFPKTLSADRKRTSSGGRNMLLPENAMAGTESDELSPKRPGRKKTIHDHLIEQVSYIIGESPRRQTSWHGEKEEAAKKDGTPRPEASQPLPELSMSNSLALTTFMRRGIKTFRKAVDEHMAVNEEEYNKGVWIDRVYDFYDPETKTSSVVKVQDHCIHRRVAPPEQKSAPDAGTGSESEVTLEPEKTVESSASSGKTSRMTSKETDGGSSNGSEKEEPIELAKRRLQKKKTTSNMNRVTNWGVIVGKLLHTRFLRFDDVTKSALGKRRIDVASRTGAVLGHVRQRAEMVAEQVQVMAKMVSEEQQDIFDSDWGSGGFLVQLFSTEYLDTFILITKGVRKLVAQQPTLVHIEPPCRVFGDTHGQLRDLLMLFHAFGHPGRGKDVPTFVFNGDYVDRGEHCLEVLGVLFAMKLAFPDKVWLLRGNHEDRQMNQLYGFEDECLNRLGRNFGKKVFEIIQAAFEHLPLALTIEKKILVVHGGIGHGKWTLTDVRSVRRPVDSVELAKPESQWIFDILWSDPIEDSLSQDLFGVHESPRGRLASQFAWDVTKTFCARNGISLIIRSHQSKEDSMGFEVMHENMVMRVFSARDYEGHGNDGAVLLIQRKDGGKERDGTVLSVRPQVLRSTTKLMRAQAAQRAKLDAKSAKVRMRRGQNSGGSAAAAAAAAASAHSDGTKSEGVVLRSSVRHKPGGAGLGPNRGKRRSISKGTEDVDWAATVQRSSVRLNPDSPVSAHRSSVRQSPS
eukprot:TRINITY_DN3314_c2_g2_i1.p1 TRINITY_DN3314_c2_g2~~TRINITY_DN3314_c2_g2_i1.p1  ORF type:complete len:855 (-),score=171.87 TRINITY_DN3314_c2_g2_i1:146-2710(-)